MNYFKSFWIIFFVVFISCDKTDEHIGTEQPDSFQELPVNISLPEAMFTDIDQVSQRISSTVIMNRLISLVDATPGNAHIHISIAGFDYPALTNALIRASERKVKVYVMFDASSESSQTGNQTTINTLERRLQGDSRIVLVNNDGRGIAINHNKFVLFSEISTTQGKKEEIVFQTSHNFTQGGTRKVQDAVLMSDQELYESFLSYWNAMEEKADSGMKNYSYAEYLNADEGLYAYFLPKRRYGGFYGDDTIIEILDDIDDPSTATIRIGMSLWTDTRINIVQKLSDLLDQGAKVEVIIKPSVGDDVFEALKEIERKGAFLKAFTYTNIHSKFMLIEGVWGGEQSKLVVTGSHNFTGNALRYNNEVILAFNNSPMFGVYDEAFDKLKKLE